MITMLVYIYLCVSIGCNEIDNELNAAKSVTLIEPLEKKNKVFIYCFPTVGVTRGSGRV